MGLILGQKDPWRRAWLPTLVFLPGESHRQRSLVGYGSWSHHSMTKPPPPPCDYVLIQYVTETLTNGEERVNIPCGRIPNCLCGDSVWGSGDWAPLLRCGLVNSPARQEGKQEQLRGPRIRQAPLCQRVQGSIKDDMACGWDASWCEVMEMVHTLWSSFPQIHKPYHQGRGNKGRGDEEVKLLWIE